MRFFTIRIPPEIKNEMDKLKVEISRSKEISESIKSKIQEQKKRKALQEAVAYIQTLPEAPKGTAQKLVRKDRDTRWHIRPLKTPSERREPGKVVPTQIQAQNPTQ